MGFHILQCEHRLLIVVSSQARNLTSTPGYTQEIAEERTYAVDLQKQDTC